MRVTGLVNWPKELNIIFIFLECLHVLCALSPVSIERCTQLSTILENCQPTPTDYKAAAAVLNAVHPLINFSTRTRDTLVMVCRKGLYSRYIVLLCRQYEMADLVKKQIH